MSDIICWFSGGVTSAVACKLAIMKYGKVNCKVIMLDTMNEHKDTYRFLKDCEKWYSLPIEKLCTNRYKNIEEVWFKHLSLNTAKGAVCSYMLKRRVREDWEKENSFKHQIFGFEDTPKERNRAKALKLNHPQTKPIFPLIEKGINKDDCLQLLKELWILPPAAYRMGFHNNNCLNTGCVQGGIGYWQKIKKEAPLLFDKMAAIEHQLTDLKGKPVTMLKDQSKEGNRKLVFLKPHKDYKEHKSIDEMKGRPVRPLMDCIGFCGVNELNDKNETENEINFE